jgi:hypothetical protein
MMEDSTVAREVLRFVLTLACIVAWGIAFRIWAG